MNLRAPESSRAPQNQGIEDMNPDAPAVVDATAAVEVAAREEANRARLAREAAGARVEQGAPPEAELVSMREFRLLQEEMRSMSRGVNMLLERAYGDGSAAPTPQRLNVPRPGGADNGGTPGAGGGGAPDLGNEAPRPRGGMEQERGTSGVRRREREWDLEEEHTRHQMKAQKPRVLELDFSLPNGQMEMELRRWLLQAEPFVRPYRTHQEKVAAASTTLGGRAGRRMMERVRRAEQPGSGVEVTWEWYKEQLWALVNAAPMNKSMLAAEIAEFTCEAKCWAGVPPEGPPRSIAWVLEELWDLMTRMCPDTTDSVLVMTVHMKLPKNVRSIHFDPPVEDMTWSQFEKAMTRSTVVNLFRQEMMEVRAKRPDEHQAHHRRAPAFSAMAEQFHVGTAPPQYLPPPPPVAPTPVAVVTHPAAPQGVTVSDVVALVNTMNDQRRWDNRGQGEWRPNQGGEQRGRGDGFRGQWGQQQQRGPQGPQQHGQGVRQWIPAGEPIPKPQLGPNDLKRAPPANARPGEWHFWSDQVKMGDFGRCSRNRICPQCKVAGHDAARCPTLKDEDFPARFFFFRNPHFNA